MDVVEDFESVTGSGVRARVAGRQVLVGQPGFLTAAGIDLSALTARIDRWEASGHTVIVVAAMRAAGLDPVLVTGDNERAARCGPGSRRLCTNSHVSRR